ncbi:MAG: cellulase family glycosylhydrolase [Butyrivibrio sp.]|nr:cellulase family glycosylhydrolase [Butyrivibrio sp.]
MSKKEKYNYGTETPWESEPQGDGSSLNSYKIVIAVLSAVIAVLAVMYALMFTGRCVPGRSAGSALAWKESETAQSGGLTEDKTGADGTTEAESETARKPADGSETEKDTDKETGMEIFSSKGTEASGENGTDTEQKPTNAPSDSTEAKPGQTQSPAQEAKPEQTQSPTQAAKPAEQTTQPASAAPANQKGTYKAEVKIVNSWEENGKKCYQLSGTVSNTSSVGINTWKIEKEIGAGSTIVQSWNCSCTLSGSKLVITPADYNGAVEAGKSANDIGLIISSSSAITEFTYSGTTTDTSVASSGNSQGGSQGGSSSSSPAPSTPVTPYEPPKLESGTPVGNHGALSLKGTDLVDKNGKKFQLKGVSTHGIQWFPQYVNKDAIKTLRDNWGANVFRIAMYTHENGYCSGGNKTELEALVSKGVEACTELGMYVIIDWHVLNERDPNVYKSDALLFFDRMSKKYKNNVNVIYEICNEPNGPSWADVKKYADDVIAVIRKNDPDAIIIVGTPTWSQDVDQVAANPVAQPKNVMYALHFYAATHKDDLRNKLKRAYAAGTPIFVSEFSICDASGNGGIDYDSANAWKKLINEYNLSFASWSLCNKNETSALLSSSTNKTSGWSDSELSAAGRWIRDFIAGK